MFLASHARHVRVLVRGPGLSNTMSRYLSERIAGSPNIAVLGETEVIELVGTPEQGLQSVRWRNRRTGAEEQHAIAHLFLFTGAIRLQPGSTAPIDEKGFIRTGADVRSTERSPLPLETGVEGIFAVGDVRCGSVKRVGAAIGEGAAVVAQLHTFLARRDPYGDHQRDACRGTPIRSPPRVAIAAVSWLQTTEENATKRATASCASRCWRRVFARSTRASLMAPLDSDGAGAALAVLMVDGVER